MYPIIAKLGPVTIYSYGLMVAIAFLLGIYIAKIEATRKNINKDLIYDLSFYIVIGSLIGARVYYIAFLDPQAFIKDPISVLKLWQGGLAIHGAILGGLLTGFLFSKIHRISFWRLADLMSPSIILGQAVGRIGCFLNSCCFGLPTESIFGIRFPKGSLPDIAYGSAAVHPTQLYELFLNIIGFFIIWSMRKRLRFDGGVFLLYLMVYNFNRIIVSTLRGDTFYIWDNLKLAHIVSAAMLIGSILVFIKRRKGA